MTNVFLLSATENALLSLKKNLPSGSKWWKYNISFPWEFGRAHMKLQTEHKDQNTALVRLKKK